MDLSKINRSAYKHSTPIQIRFVDIDLAGHVNNATILTYFETARIAYFDDIIGKANDWGNRGLILAHTEIDYLIPVYLQDTIKVYSRITKIGTKSFTMENLLVKEENGKEIFASIASFVTVCMNYSTKQTIEIPGEWKVKFQNVVRA